MIKLSNKEALALLSPTAQKLFADSSKPFPTKESFMILDLIQLIEQRIKLFHKQVNEVVEKYEGKVSAARIPVFKKETNRIAAEEEIQKLKEVQLEYPCEKFKLTDDWPKLSVEEAYILKPLIYTE